MKLDARIENDSEYIADLKLCQLRLKKEGDLDWFILVPKKENCVEWIDLDENEQIQLTREITQVSQTLKEVVRPDKINVASLGNMVPQLHIHVIARFKDDRAWPGATFGTLSQKEFGLERVSFWKKRFPHTY